MRISLVLMRYAMQIVAERLIPALQCTKIFPFRMLLISSKNKINQSCELIISQLRFGLNQICLISLNCRLKRFLSPFAHYTLINGFFADKSIYCIVQGLLLCGLIIQRMLLHELIMYRLLLYRLTVWKLLLYDNIENVSE